MTVTHVNEEVDRVLSGMRPQAGEITTECSEHGEQPCVIVGNEDDNHLVCADCMSEFLFTCFEELLSIERGEE